jgi:hypothetical protein
MLPAFVDMMLHLPLWWMHRNLTEVDKTTIICSIQLLSRLPSRFVVLRKENSNG